MTSSLLKSKSNRLIEIRNVPAVEAGAYADGDLIGGKQTLLNAVEEVDGAGAVTGMRVISTGALAQQLDCVLFNADPTNTTFTENGAFALNTADAAKVIGVVKLDTYTALNAPGVATHAFGELCLPFVLDGGTSLYLAMVARGAITPAATTGVEVRLTIARF